MTTTTSTWKVGSVDRREEHIQILYDATGDEALLLSRWFDISVGGQNQFALCICVALVAPATANTFTVQWLIDPDLVCMREIVKAVQNELTFYLVEKRSLPPWEYAKYHCATASNLYSKVHWTYHTKESPS